MGRFKRVKVILSIALICTLIIALPSCGTNNGNDADLVIQNGKVYTVDDKSSMAEAVAVKDGAIVFVGSTADAKSYIGKDTEVMDIEGKMLLPGMIDSHLHPMVMELAKKYKLDLSACLTEKDTLNKIEEYVKANPDRDIYYGDLFSLGAFSGVEAEKGPKKERLDEISPDKAIILGSNDGLTVWMNTKGFELAKITKDTPNPNGGEIVKGSNGELWGTLRADAVKLAPAQQFTFEQKVDALKEFQSFMSSLGYTSIFAAPYEYEAPLAEFRELEEKGELALRVNGAIGIYQDQPLEEQLENLSELKKEFSEGNIRLTTAKFFADGVVEGLSADLLEPYDTTDEEGNPVNGYTRYDYDLMKDAFVKVSELGVQIHVHSVGDASTRNVLDNFEYLYSINPEAKDNRNSITHLQLVDPADILRFKELNVTAVVQPYWMFKEVDWWDIIEKPILGDRADTEYPLKSLFDAGAVVATSSDHAVTPIPNPFWAIETGITRNLNNPKAYGVKDITDMDDPKYLLNKEERATVDQMIRSLTINGAYNLLREKEIGSIEVGKFADMIVVDRDITAINPIEIDQTKVLYTIFNGEVVYKAEK